MLNHLDEWRGHINHFLKMNIDPGMRVMDIGIGRTTPVIRSIVGSTNLTILDKTHIAVLPKTMSDLIEDSMYIQGDLLNMTDMVNINEVHSPEVIVCSEVLEHVEDLSKARDGLLKLAKGGKRILITVPCNIGHHPNPHYGDYWRFMPTSIQTLFPDNFVREIPYTIPNNDMYYGIGAIIHV